ncbi:hypothetical protein VKT23_008142 [Stygiomarasmius scandens]|uniref:F-box domain-containing protein n=1 Tax=Marasmiellus scandens TaxID=2682957 RepID=A0ABR1JHF2_9AGAR
MSPHSANMGRYEEYYLVENPKSRVGRLTMTMERLPTKVIQCIGRKLDESRDQANFRLTCRTINAAIEPVLFESVEIAIHGRDLSKRSTLLLNVLIGRDVVESPSRPRFLERKSRLVLLVHRLKIHSLDSSEKVRSQVRESIPPPVSSVETTDRRGDGMQRKTSKRGASGSGTQLIRKFSKTLNLQRSGSKGGAVGKSRERRLEERLASIAALKNINSVIWHIWSSSNGYQVYDTTIYKALGSLPSLNQFTLAVPGLTPLVLPDLNLRDLRMLRVQCSLPPSTEEVNHYILDPLLSVINDSPGLTDLQLDFRTNHLNPEGTTPPTLGEFFTKISVSVSLPIPGSDARVRTHKSLDLERLTLRGWNIDFLEPRGSTAAMHLRKLSKLRIVDSSAVQSTFWRVLEREQVRLREISVRTLPRPFLDYLESYSGVEILEVHPSSNRDETVGALDNRGCDRCEHQNLASQFYQAVQKHRRSLRKLSIQGFTRGKWCLGEHNMQPVMACRELQELVACLDPKAIGQAGQRGDVVTMVMYMMTQMPSLRTLRLYIARSMGPGGCPNCASDSDEKLGPVETTTAQIEKSIWALQPHGNYPRGLRIYLEDRCVDWRKATRF